MERTSEISISIGALGVVITLIGLFPGIIGLETAEGVGVLQVLIILLGFTILYISAYYFAKRAFYPGQSSSLAQDIGIRLTMTGLLVAGAAGLADVLGFGSHPSTPGSRPMIGRLQAVVFIGGILLASSGVIIYVLFGPPPEDDEPDAGPGDQDAPPAGG
ncbi:MAG: hypothetical protein OZ934_01510 [Anaerolineae bacterium]|nr:hypothetical protein [Anaerolineae bacterium]